MNKRHLLLLIVATAIVATLPRSASAASCNPSFVVQHGRTFTVLPTGVDDTPNLQCAFDSAAAAGSSAVRLEKGTYHIRQIVVNNFKGSYTGAGAEQSVLTNLPNLYVTPFNMYYQPPSAANPWPSLVSFVDGDFLVSDIGMKITGAVPTTGWTIYGLPTLYDLALGFTVLGTTSNAVFSRVDIEGEVAPNPVCNYNLYNGIGFEGLIGQESQPPISGSFVVQNSTFQHLGSAVPVYNVVDASVLLSHNNAQDVFDAMDLQGLLNTMYEFSFNTVEGSSYGGYLYDATSAEGTTELCNLFGDPGQQQRLQRSVRGLPRRHVYGHNHLPGSREQLPECDRFGDIPWSGHKPLPRGGQ
jgi:hypothetical protein